MASSSDAAMRVAKDASLTSLLGQNHRMGLKGSCSRVAQARAQTESLLLMIAQAPVSCDDASLV